MVSPFSNNQSKRLLPTKISQDSLQTIDLQTAEVGHCNSSFSIIHRILSHGPRLKAVVLCHNGMLLALASAIQSEDTKHIYYFFFLKFIFLFLLGIFLVYISNAIPKVPHTHPPNPLPTHSPFLSLAFPCTGAYRVCKSKGPLFPVMAD